MALVPCLAAKTAKPQGPDLAQGVECTLEDACKRPAAEPLERAVPVVDTLWKTASQRSREETPGHRLEELPVVRRGGAGIGPRPHCVGQHRPVSVHLAT